MLRGKISDIMEQVPAITRILTADIMIRWHWWIFIIQPMEQAGQIHGT